MLIQAGSDNGPCHAGCCGEGKWQQIFFLLIVKFGDKLAAPNKTSSQKIATANFHHVKVK